MASRKCVLLGLTQATELRLSKSNSLKSDNKKSHSTTPA